MGYRARWLAVKNADPAQVLRTIGLVQDSASSEAIYDPGHYALAMPGGWFVVIGDGADFMDTVEEEHARALSIGTESLHFSCDDTSMGALLKVFREGKEVWAVEYDGSNGPGTPVVTGTPPAVVGETIAKCRAAQHASGRKDVDHVYDAAAELGQVLTGFRHDQTLGDGEHLPILVLRPA